MKPRRTSHKPADDAKVDEPMSIVAVARKAGVSVATVSRVLNDADGVRRQTVEQVRAAMTEIGYTPPQVKRGPKGGRRRQTPSGLRTGQISILNLGGGQGWLGLPVISAAVTGAMRAAKEQDVRSVLDEMVDPFDISPIIRRREVDAAVLFVPGQVNEAAVTAIQQFVPVVWVMGARTHMPPVDHIAPDHVGVGQLAFEYLFAQGCKSFAYLSDTPDAHYKRLRAQGFGNAAFDAGQTVTNFLVQSDERPTQTHVGPCVSAPTLEEVVDRLVVHAPRPQGLFVPTDLLLSAVHPMLLARGVVPERDIRVISCDNETSRLEHMHPRPVSIDLRSEEIGKSAVRQLIHRIQQPNDPLVRMQIRPMIPPRLRTV
ncbi:MAG: LacI family DNA-binding transcriptional regulator [Tepidisphaeraceae bacterium]